MIVKRTANSIDLLPTLGYMSQGVSFFSQQCSTLTMFPKLNMCLGACHRLFIYFVSCSAPKFLIKMNSFVVAYIQCELMVLRLLSIFFSVSTQSCFFCFLDIICVRMISVFVCLQCSSKSSSIKTFFFATRKQQEHVYSLPSVYLHWWCLYVKKINQWLFPDGKRLCKRT